MKLSLLMVAFCGSSCRKITDYRAVAQRVMDMVQPSLPYRRAVADTAIFAITSRY